MAAYTIQDKVNVADGQGENKPVFFECSVPIMAWDSLVKAQKKSDAAVYHQIAIILTDMARHELDKSMAFVPHARQFILYDPLSGEFVINYRMIGRNTLGIQDDIIIPVSIKLHPAATQPQVKFY